MRPVPADGNNTRMVDRGTQVGGEVYTGVDSTTGQTVSLTVDCKEVLIVPTPEHLGTPYYLIGTITGYTDPVPLVGPWPLPVVVSPGETICTLKAVSGTIDLSIVILR